MLFLSTSPSTKLLFRRLYRTIDLTAFPGGETDDDQELQSKYTRCKILCLKTLSSRPHLASLVRCFRLTMHATHPTLALWQLIHYSLLHMHTLSSLSLDLRNTLGDLSDLLKSVPFTLRSLQTTLPLTEPFIAYLDQHQSDITELSLRGYSGALHGLGAGQLGYFESPLFSPWTDSLNTFFKSVFGEEEWHGPTLPSTFLPKLSTFRTSQGRMDLLKEVLPGRPIRRATLPLAQGQTQTTLSLLCKIKENATDLKDLTLMVYESGDHHSLMLISEIAECLPQLEALQIIFFMERVTLDTLEATSPSFSAFQRLRCLTILSNLATQEEAIDERARKIADMWYEHCRSLQTIILPSGLVWFRPDGEEKARTI
ncbi:hypothetical protein DL96DRAFT_296634 [Flagelloscypha sp. PMI_526]|nr:hypothetical protein DL96DRAFT_296634 [Flagelloscypha sp. PMI_526]